jgi:hypothetical protein
LYKDTKPIFTAIAIKHKEKLLFCKKGYYYIKEIFLTLYSLIVNPVFKSVKKKNQNI